MNRPYISKSLVELRALAMGQSDQSVISDVLDELTFRTRPAAKAFEDELQKNNRNGTPALDLFRTANFEQIDREKAPKQNPKSTSRPSPKSKKSPKKPKFPPTEEQRVAIDAFMQGDSLKVTAFAGAGKTSTLVQMANIRDGRGLYLAFNRAIANEAAEEFPSSVECRTTHSVALRSIRSSHRFSKDKLFNAIQTKQLAATLNLEKQVIANAVTFTDVQQAHLFLSTIRRFCQSKDTSICAQHVPKSGRLLAIEPSVRDEIERWSAKEATKVWNQMLSVESEIPLGHDGYLKLWSLSDPILDSEFILLDEAQDTNPAVMSVLEKQSAQLVYVGDSHQQIYAWRGAIDAMAQAHAKQQSFLTQSFRFGSEIASAASDILATLGETKRIRGNPKIESRITNGQNAGTVLTRTNAMAISEVLDALDSGRLPHIVGGAEDMRSLVSDVFNLMENKPATRPEFFGFGNWNQVIAFSETDEGDDLKAFVGLVQKYGARALWAALKQTTASEAEADILISTAHKAKGRQWESVRIADDFANARTKTGAIPEEESRLFYVAITRAQQELQIDPNLLKSFATGRIESEKLIPATPRAAPTVAVKVAAIKPPPPIPTPVPTVVAPDTVVRPHQKQSSGISGFFSKLLGLK